MDIIKEVPDVNITVEHVCRFMDTQFDKGAWVVRVVYRRSDDGRRMTDFYQANKHAAESMHMMLLSLMKHDCVIANSAALAQLVEQLPRKQ